jgi:hypothetical protein
MCSSDDLGSFQGLYACALVGARVGLRFCLCK